MNPSLRDFRPHPRQGLKLVVICAVTGAALWLGIHSAINTRGMQQRMACQGNLARIHQALSKYATPNGHVILESLANGGMLEKSALVCPGAREPNYILVPPGPVADASKRVLIYEPLSNHEDGVNALFADGRCLFVQRKDIKSLGLSSEK